MAPLDAEERLLIRLDRPREDALAFLCPILYWVAAFSVIAALAYLH